MVLAGLRQVKNGQPRTAGSGPHAPLFARRAVRGALGLDSLEYFLAVNRDVFRRVDPDTNLVALNAQDRDRNFFANHDGLADSSSENEHVSPQ